MCDEAVTRYYRVIAFDLPWHGKSYPPAGWQESEYRLTTQRYVETIRAFCAALAARSPGRDGMLDRRTHRAAARPRARRGVSRADRSGVGRLPAALVRHQLAASRRRARRRSLRCSGLGAGRAAKPGRISPRDALAVHARRPRRVQRRSVLLPRRCRSARQAGRHRHVTLPALSAHRGVRLLLHAGGHAAHGEPRSRARR